MGDGGFPGIQREIDGGGRGELQEHAAGVPDRVYRVQQYVMQVEGRTTRTMRTENIDMVS